MHNLTYKEKLKIALDLCEKLGITAYNIGENTSLNASGVQRILNKTVTPQAKTVNILYDYITELEIIRKQKKSPKITENISQVGKLQSNSFQEMIARQVNNTLKPLLSEIINQQQENNQLLKKNRLKIDAIKGELEAIKKCLSEI